MLVVTHSVSPTLDEARQTQQKNGSSVHYIIDKDGKQYQYHNDLTSKTFLSGVSSWKGTERVNDFSIGIMFIHDSESEFPAVQIETVIKLLEDIKNRYPDLDLQNNLLWLGEVAQRHIVSKVFPFKQLAELGFGKFIDTTQEQREKVLIQKDDEGEQVSAVQAQLKDHGYGITVTGKCGEADTTWFTKFNTRYVPEQSPLDNWTQGSQYVLDALHDNNIPLTGDHDSVFIAGDFNCIA